MNEISEMRDLSEQDVTRHAARLVRLGYVEAESSGNASAWTLISDVG